MAANITFKKGQQANLPVLAEAEPAFTTDTKKLFIGSSAGNIEIGTQYWAYDPAQNNVLYKTAGNSLNVASSTLNTNIGPFATTTGYKNYPVAKLSFVEGLLNFAGYPASSYTIIDIDPETHTMTLNSVADLTTDSICYATNQGSITVNNGVFVPVRIFITNIDTENSKITYDSTKEDINYLEGDLKSSYLYFYRMDTTINAGSHVEGRNNMTLSQYGHVEGYSNFSSAGVNHVEGAYNKATGNCAHAEGYTTQATGNDSHSEGSNTISSAQSSHSEGNATNASGPWSHAEGYLSVASANGAHAEGQETTASGQYSHAEGNTTQAKGESSHSEGYQTLAEANYSHAEGQNSEAIGVASHAEGNLTFSSGVASHSEGHLAYALGDYSHAEGQYSGSGGTGSHSEGQYCGTGSLNSHAEGYATIAVVLTGATTTAISSIDEPNAKITVASSAGFSVGNVVALTGGVNATHNTPYVFTKKISAIDGNVITFTDNAALECPWTTMTLPGEVGDPTDAACHAEGVQSQATGKISHAEGYNAWAQGTCSHAQNNDTWVYSHSGTAIGKTNNPRKAQNNPTTFSSTNDAFFVGNGPTTYLSNAFRVNFSGNVYSQASYNTGGADYAEYFEWADANILEADRVAKFVKFDPVTKYKIVFCDGTPGEKILGVVSSIPSVIGNSFNDEWKDMYLQDKYGRKLKDSEGNFIINPDYDPEQEYIPREERPEWDPIGLVGMTPVLDDGTCVPGGRCISNANGEATATTDGTGFYVLLRLSDDLILIMLDDYVGSDFVVQHGIESELPTSLSTGELAYATDTGVLYIGNEDGDKQTLNVFQFDPTYGVIYREVNGNNMRTNNTTPNEVFFSSQSNSFATGLKTFPIGVTAYSEGILTISGLSDEVTITSINPSTNTVVLQSLPSSLTVGNLVILKNSASWFDLVPVKVETINTSNLSFTYSLVDSRYVPTEAYNVAYVRVTSGDPQSGTHAEGSYTVAIGRSAHAEGGSTEAIGTGSHSEGLNSKSYGVAAHSEGRGNEARGEYSHAEGLYSVAGLAAHSEGTYSGAIAAASHAEGTGTFAIVLETSANIVSLDPNTSSIVVDSATGFTSNQKVVLYDGVTVNSGFPLYQVKSITSIDGNTIYFENNDGLQHAYSKISYSNDGNNGVLGSPHAEGISTKALARGAHAEGSETIASGPYSHAEGNQTAAYGESSHAEGYKTVTSGDYSHAEGWNSTASALHSHAEGQQTQAIGTTSHAEGINTIAYGAFSHSQGGGTQSYAYASMAMGCYNNPRTSSNNSGAYTSGNDALIIGNGDISTPSNCFRVMFNGAAYGLSAYNSSGADYAEYFEWQDGNPNGEDRVGKFVKLSSVETDKIELATGATGERILGIVSATPTVIGNSYSDQWQGMYLTDDFGRFLLDENKNFIVNPEYNPEQEYVAREDRPEWSAVGFMGRVRVQDDGSCVPGGLCKPSANGIATTSESNGYVVLKRITSSVVEVLLK